jgi:pimeloyl-ACP methyl ester carboxylesterase
VVASKRKDSFPGRQSARESFATRPAFSGWDSDAIAGYVECGLIGEGPVELACDPQVEAEIYRGSRDHATWVRLGEIETPALVLCGEDSDTVTPDLARAQAMQLSRAGVDVVPGTGHFLPMERPDLVAERVRRVVEAFS